MKRWPVLLVACLALGLVVAGCGGDDDDGDSGSADTQEQPAPEAEGGGAEAEGGGPAEVSMESITFKPEEVTVATGDTVTWVNNDTVGHDVTADDFKSGEPGAMENGDSFEQTFDTAGTFDYVCTVHPGMTGSVTVE